MRCLTWNLEWARPKSQRAAAILEIVRGIDPDVVCYTEVLTGMMPDGYVIEAHPDYGYSHAGDRRKVMLWSKTPWEQVDNEGSPSLPSGRFVTGITASIRFVGVCIPWKDAHVTTGRKDRARWEDHLTFCHGLKGIVEGTYNDGSPVCVLGDFNQCVPRAKQPELIANALADVFPSDFTVSSAGVLDADGKPVIDHIVISRGLFASDVRAIAKKTSCGLRLSDHVGIMARLERTVLPQSAVMRGEGIPVRYPLLCKARGMP